MNESPDYMKPDYLKKIAMDSKRTADAVEKLVRAVRVMVWVVCVPIILMLLQSLDGYS